MPSARLAELPPGVGFEPKDEKVFGRILIEQQGEDLFETEEDVRFLGKRLRFGYDIALDGRSGGVPFWRVFSTKEPVRSST